MCYCLSKIYCTVFDSKALGIAILLKCFNCCALISTACTVQRRFMCRRTMILWVVNTNASLSDSLKRYKIDPRVFKWVGYGVAGNAALMAIAEEPGLHVARNFGKIPTEAAGADNLLLLKCRLGSAFTYFILLTIQRLHETDITRWRFNAASCARSRTFQVQEADGSTVLHSFH